MTDSVEKLRMTMIRNFKGNFRLPGAPITDRLCRSELRQAGFSCAFCYALVHEVLVRRPKLRIYLENAGQPFLHEMIALMYQYPQVYADLSTITRVVPREAFRDYLRALMRAGYGERLMFGTDSAPSWLPEAIESIESASFLTDGQKRDIFYNNAARFLRLTEEEIASHHDR